MPERAALRIECLAMSAHARRSISHPISLSLRFSSKSFYSGSTSGVLREYSGDSGVLLTDSGGTPEYSPPGLLRGSGVIIQVIQNFTPDYSGLTPD